MNRLFFSFRFSITDVGGLIQIGNTTIEWTNTRPPGTQLMGAPFWGWTTVVFPTRHWYFGR